MPRALTLFVIAALCGLFGGYAFGTVLAMLFKQNDPQTALLWSIAAIPAIGVGIWCQLAGRRARRQAAEGGKI